MLVSYCYNTKDKFCMKMADSYLLKNNSIGCVNDGMFLVINRGSYMSAHVLLKFIKRVGEKR